MEGITRKPLQGIGNIIRFNWHFYVIAVASVCVLLIANQFVAGAFHPLLNVISTLIVAGTCFSLLISFYVYDLSNLYSLDWLDGLSFNRGVQIININAGFDETSHLLSAKYPAASITALDFYDSAKHTEVSIARARKAHAVFPGTKVITTGDIPLETGTVDHIFAIMSAHEIRNEYERIIFFKLLRYSLKKDGKIVVVEHLRDVSNFIAYNIGFLHFYSKQTWKHSFSEAGLCITKEIKITPFISAFILGKNGITS